MLIVLDSLAGKRMDACLRLVLILLAVLLGIIFVFCFDMRAGIYGVSSSPILLGLSMIVDFNMFEFFLMLLILFLAIGC